MGFNFISSNFRLREAVMLASILTLENFKIKVANSTNNNEKKTQKCR